MAIATTESGAGARAKALRRDSDNSRRDFTTLLDVLARPGTIGVLDVRDGAPAVAIAACGLLDVEVGTHVISGLAADEQSWADAVYAATNAPRSELGTARTVVALRPVTALEIADLNRGDALNPEHGARLFAAVDSVAEPGTAADETVLSLSGPGIRGVRQLAVRGLAVSVFEALIAANASFPAGVDTFLVAADGAVAGLPRTTRVRIESADTDGA